jgi:hypothetical protein
MLTLLPTSIQYTVHCPSNLEPYNSQIQIPDAVAIGSHIKWGNVYLDWKLIYFVFVQLCECELNSTALYDPVSNFINTIKKFTFSQTDENVVTI